VRVTKDARVGWYPSGYAGVGPRRWKRCSNPDDAELEARKLRADLRALRAGFGDTSLPGPHRTVEDAYIAWLEYVHQHHPEGTWHTYASRANVWFSLIGANRCGEMCLDLVLAPLKAARDRGVSDRTFDGIYGALMSFVSWGIVERWLPVDTKGNKETWNDAVRRVRTPLIRNSANTRTQDQVAALTSGRGPSWDDDNDTQRGIVIDSVPTHAEIEALGRAVETVQTKPAPWHKETGRGAGGGRGQLDPHAAWRISKAPGTQAATGLRPMELLVIHADNIDPLGELHVQFQLDRYKRWQPGEPPPAVPLKHNKRPRTALVHAYWMPTLLELAAFAREHCGGWLFAPTGRQTWWAESFAALLDRAKRLLEYEYQKAVAATQNDPGLVLPPRFDYRPHDLRHHYGSYSISPVAAGGYGLDPKLVSESMGHTSLKVTLDTYYHAPTNARAHWAQASALPPR
jgi:integrase